MNEGYVLREIEKEIKKEDGFLKVTSSEDMFNYIDKEIKYNNFNRDNTKLCLVVCRDDINFVVNGDRQNLSRAYKQKNIVDMFQQEYGSSMNLGGLGGFMTAGYEGLNACSHHTPQDKENNLENIIILYSAHIGFNDDKGFGYSLRNFQNEPSSNCGLLQGLTKVFVNEEYLNIEDMGLEAGFAYKNLFDYSKEIKNSNNPILKTTLLTQNIIRNQVSKALKKLDNLDNKNLFIVDGIIINTDRDKPDYFALVDYGIIVKND
jgi:hypothetical protein